MYKSAPTLTTLYDYSQDLDNASGGRLVQPSGSSAATSATWTYQFPGTAKVIGSTGSQSQKISEGEITLWAQKTATAPTISATLTVGTTSVPVTSFSSASWTCTGMQMFQLGFQVPNDITVAANATMTLTITSSQNAYLGYGTSIFPSELTLPVSGNA